MLLEATVGPDGYRDVHVSIKDAKADRAGYPFAQLPRLVDRAGGGGGGGGVVDVCQTGAIVRHLARRDPALGWYGRPGSLAEAARVDAWLEGCEALRIAHFALNYTDRWSDAATEAALTRHVRPATAVGDLETEQMGPSKPRGAHFGYLDALLGDATWCVGGSPTVADLALMELFEVWSGAAPELAATWPRLAAHRDRVAALPAMSAYLASGRRPARINGNGLGEGPDPSQKAGD